MQSSLIGKIQKANLYAREPEAVTLWRARRDSGR